MDKARHLFCDKEPKPGQRVQLWCHEWEGPQIVSFHVDRHGPYWAYRGRSMPAWRDDEWCEVEAS